MNISTLTCSLRRHVSMSDLPTSHRNRAEHWVLSTPEWANPGHPQFDGAGGARKVCMRGMLCSVFWRSQVPIRNPLVYVRTYIYIHTCVGTQTCVRNMHVRCVNIRLSAYDDNMHWCRAHRTITNSITTYIYIYIYIHNTSPDPKRQTIVRCSTLKVLTA